MSAALEPRRRLEDIPALPATPIVSLEGSLTLPWSAQVAHARESVKTGQEGSQGELARMLLRAYNHGQDTSCLAEAVVLLRELHALSSADVLGQRALDLGNALFAEHSLTGRVEPIEEILSAHGRLPPNDNHRMRLDCQHAKALLARGAFTGSKIDVVQAKEIIDAVASSRIASFSVPDFLIISATYHVIMWRMSSQYDLKELSLLKSSLNDLITRNTVVQERLGVLNSYISISRILCTTNNDCDNLSEAITIIEDVISAQGHGRPFPDLFECLSSLSRLYIYLAEQQKDIAYMSKSKYCIDRMSSLVKENNIHRSEVHDVSALHLFLLRCRFQVGDATVVFGHTAGHWRAALSNIPQHHAYCQQYLIGLTTSLAKFFQHTGSVSALNEGVALAHIYLDMAHTNPPLAMSFADLLRYRAIAGRLRLASKRGLLQQARDVLRVSLHNTPHNHLHRTALLQSLSSVYGMQSKAGLCIPGEELAAARSSVTSAIEAGIDAQISTKFVLARVLLGTARDTQNIASLNEAATLLEWLTEQVPSVTVIYERRRNVLAWLQSCFYLVRFRVLGARADLDRAEMGLEVLARDQPDGLGLETRVRQCLEWAETARLIGELKLEMRAYRHAVALLPQLVFLGGDIGTMLEALQLVEGVSARAAVLALDMDDVPSAIELLEETRGVVWSQSLRLRAEPEEVPPQHAEAFAHNLGGLKKAGKPVERRKHAKDLEEIIKQIRQVNGCERFLLPRRYAELRACASHGTIVLVIPSDTATDVILIPSLEAEPIHLRLSALKLARVQELTAKMKRSSDQARNSTSEEQRGMKKVEVGDARLLKAELGDAYVRLLRELWTELVHPVISRLGFQRTSPDAQAERPRLWWCPTGPFAELPIHAAGIYTGSSQDNLANYVVSSYTPTLSALITARSSATRDTDPNILLVSVPKASGFAPLPNAEVEVDRIKEVIALADLTTVSDSEASIANVLEGLTAASVLHLACHGHQSQEDPLTSGFSLNDGRLTLERLMQLQLPRAELAYLSACETASTDEYQPDEAINLAATMLFVGFKSVIATMWSMNDLDGPFIAQRVYRTIFQSGKLDLRSVPYALDAAVRELRESGVHPSRWATYVHIGA